MTLHKFMFVDVGIYICADRGALIDHISAQIHAHKHAHTHTYYLLTNITFLYF